jgi:hypothetical protein
MKLSYRNTIDVLIHFSMEITDSIPATVRLVGALQRLGCTAAVPARPIFGKCPWARTFNDI